MSCSPVGHGVTFSHSCTARSGGWLTENCAHLDSPNLTHTNISLPFNFTFVNQAEDLLSLSHRKISNVKQRHDIRSHVMQRVRKKESSQGKKRATGRNRPKQSTLVPLRGVSGHPSSSWETEFTSSTVIAIKQEPSSLKPHALAVKHEKGELSCPTTVFGHSRLSISPAAHKFDPFQTLPNNGLPPKSLESLLQYCP